MSSVSLINGHIDDDKKQPPKIDYDKLMPENYVIECATKLAEKQEEIILKTIQHIGNIVHIDYTIDKNKVIEALTDYQRKINSTADLVEVVRCKDCKYHHWEQEAEHGKTVHICSVIKAEVFRDFYCYYGERRDKK